MVNQIHGFVNDQIELFAGRGHAQFSLESEDLRGLDTLAPALLRQQFVGSFASPALSVIVVELFITA